MTVQDAIPLAIVLLFAFYLVLERLIPATPQPKVRRWFLTGTLFFVMCFVMNGAIPAIAMSIVGEYTVFDLRGLGTVGGAALMLLAGDLISYWIHRGMHNNAFVWRWTHQLHHSAERMDMLGASFFHPLDFLFQNVLPSIAIGIVLGVTPLTAAVGGILGFAVGVFPHLNVRTPRWLGYVLQRPEMHAVHHQRDVHAYNYGSLAISDLLFGTWRNPDAFPAGPYGFWDGASAQIGAMLIGRDVSAPR